MLLSRAFWWLCLLFCLFPFGAQAADSGRNDVIAFSLPEVETYTLKNGLNVSLIQYGKIPKLNVVFNSPNHSALNTATRKLLCQMLIENDNRSEYDIENQSLTELGATINCNVKEAHLGIELDVLSRKGHSAIKVLGRLLQSAKFHQEQAVQTKHFVTKQLQSQKRDAFTQLDELLMAGMRGDSVADYFTKTESPLQNITISTLKEVMQSQVLNSESHLYISGLFDPVLIKRAIADSFSSLELQQTTKKRVAKPSFEHGKIIIVDQPGATQTLLKLGLPVVSPAHEDFDGLAVINSLSGGAVSSRITQNIREEKGYAYYPYSKIETQGGWSYWTLFTELSAENTGNAIIEILREIDKLKTTAVAISELNGFKRYTVGKFIFRSFSRIGMIDRLWLNKVFGLSITELESYPERIASLTPADITAISTRYFAIDAMTLVLIGDSDLIKQQLLNIDVLQKHPMVELQQ